MGALHIQSKFKAKIGDLRGSSRGGCMIKIVKRLLLKICKNMLYLFITILQFTWQISNIITTGSACPSVFFLQKEKKIAYLQIPKVANTSIISCIFKADGKNYEDIHIKLIPQRKNITILLKEFYKSIEFSEYFKFTFVRNPFTRLVSCYENKYHTDKALLGDTRYFLYYDTYLFGMLKEDRGFANFVHKVTKIPVVLADLHFYPQYNYIYDRSGNKCVDLIGRMEIIDDDWDAIKEKYKLDTLPHINQTKSMNWMDYYDRTTAELVYKYYEKDIITFGYEDSYNELIKCIETKECQEKLATVKML